MSHVHKDKSLKKAEKHGTNIPVTAGTATTGTGLGAAPLVTPAPVVHRAAIPVAPVAPPVVMPVAGMQTLSMADRVVNEPERIIRHEPIIEKEILREPALEVKREHHIQPIIHETEHQIQPIIKTEATTERPVIFQDRNVMMEPVLERAALPVGLEAVERVAPEGIIHAPKLERQIVNERPVEVRREHHVQPIIHEREHRIQPIIKTEATTERTIIEQDINVMHEPIVERAALPAGLEAVERVAAEGIIHRPRVAKDVIVEHPVQIRHEHHVQPIIHEREHHIQPIIKTEITAEETHLKTDRNVMLEPILERAALPAGLEAVERAGPEGVLHRARVETEVIQERTLQINREHHIQPIIHERVHHIQPIIKTEVTTEQPVIEEEHSVMLPPIIEPTVLVDRGLVDRGLPVLPTAVPAGGPVVATTTLPHTAGLSASEPLPQVPVVERGHPLNVAPVGTLDSERGLTGTGGAPLATDRAVPLAAKEGALGTTAATTVTHKPTVGQRLKGAVKQLQGSITGNEVKKEEGKLISEGIDTATAHATAVSQSTAGTLL